MEPKFKKGDKVILRATKKELQDLLANGVPNKIYYIHRLYKSSTFGVLYELIDLDGNYSNYHKEEWLHYISILKCELL